MASHPLNAPEERELPTRKLNIFALPSQTTILAVLIICVIYATAIAISIGPALFPLWPLMLGLSLLSLRAWLGWPERQQRLHQLTPADQQFPAMQALIAQLTTDLRLKRIPRLMISHTAEPLYIYGGWRRWYIAIGEQRATEIEQALDDPENRPYIEAVFLHELHHFKLGDHRLIEYTRALLHSGWQFLSWGGIMISASVLFVALTMDELVQTPLQEYGAAFEAQLPGIGIRELANAALLSDAERLELRQMRPHFHPLEIMLYTVTNTGMIVIISAILVSLVWRKLLRLRELYADAGVVHIQGTIEYLLHGTSVTSSMGPIYTDTPVTRHTWQLLKTQTSRYLAMLGPMIPISFNWFQYHPSWKRRKASLTDPRYVFDDWPKSAWLIGLFVLLLEVVLTQTTAQAYVGQWPLHSPVITTFILISLISIVEVILGRPAWHYILRCIRVVIIARACLTVLTIIVFIVAGIMIPSTTGRRFLVVSYWFTRYANTDQVVTVETLKSLVLVASIKQIIQLVAIYLLLIGVTWVQLKITQRILRWYGYTSNHLHIMHLIYCSIVLLILILGFVVLPIVTDLVLWRYPQALPLWRWLLILSMILIGLGVYLWFRYQDRRYAEHCPTCSRVLDGPYTFGRRCSFCSQLLHEWLYVDYTGA